MVNYFVGNIAVQRGVCVGEGEEGLRYEVGWVVYEVFGCVIALGISCMCASMLLEYVPDILTLLLLLIMCNNCEKVTCNQTSEQKQVVNE